MKLALGTAQFGFAYGATNARGQVSAPVAGEILAYLGAQGLDTVDTAPAYGESEACLGRVGLPASITKVVTKVVVGEDPARVGASLAESLSRLELASVYSLLVHDEQALLDPSQGDRVWAELAKAKERGLARKVGVSVYGPEAALELRERYPLDLIQFPLNPLDQRFVPHLASLADQGVELHARSLFLQGVLLARALPPRLGFLAPALGRFAEETRLQCGGDPLTACLAFAQRQAPVDRFVLGFTSVAEAREAVAAYARARGLPPELHFTPVMDEAQINPARWPREQP